MRRENAVVCGGSMAGLLAARVLSEFYESVTVVERDDLPEWTHQRRGVPQGHHLHNLMSRGSRILEELFPGLFEQLAADGANIMEGIDPAVVHMRFGDHLLNQSGELSRPEDLVAHLASRPLLEAHVRRRVRAIDNVAFLDGHEAIEPVIGVPGRVTAVRVAGQGAGERLLDADMVADATGRSARMPAFLLKHGYHKPVERRYAVGLRYSSQFFKVPRKSIPEQIVLVAPNLERPTGAGLLAYENGTVILTLIGMAGRRLPTDLMGLLAFGAELLPSHITEALRASEPIGGVTAQHYPTSVWRRYDKLGRFPTGLLVIGDAFCSFNPLYGQGMTSAALQARALRRCLTEASDDVPGRYFRASAKLLQRVWRGNQLNDFTLTPADGWRRISQHAVSWYLDKVMAAAANDMVLTEAFVRTLNMLDSPTAMMHPSLLARVIAGNRRAARGQVMDP